MNNSDPYANDPNRTLANCGVCGDEIILYRGKPVPHYKPGRGYCRVGTMREDLPTYYPPGEERRR